MTEKVKVSHEVARALDFVKLHFDFEDIMKKQISEKWVGGDLLCLNRLSVERVARLLIAGYEIEETPEEKLLANFNWIKDEYKKAFDKGDDYYIAKYQGMFDGVKSTLETLGIKIKGINE